MLVVGCRFLCAKVVGATSGDGFLVVVAVVNRVIRNISPACIPVH